MLKFKEVNTSAINFDWVALGTGVAIGAGIVALT
ncbi:Uncharacterised protein [Macrococcoides caseolyticum]|nr:Uncharacterised protein [Macrococcus caseolyticus]